MDGTHASSALAGVGSALKSLTSPNLLFCAPGECLRQAGCFEGEVLAFELLRVRRRLGLLGCVGNRKLSLYYSSRELRLLRRTLKSRSATSWGSWRNVLRSKFSSVVLLKEEIPEVLVDRASNEVLPSAKTIVYGLEELQGWISSRHRIARCGIDRTCCECGI